MFAVLEFGQRFVTTLANTMVDVAPIVTVILVFQFVVLRERIPNFARVIQGFVYVVLGMALFLIGLDLALFPLGKEMATQLTAERFLGPAENREWFHYGWVYVFAAALGFATTIAEPALLAVALKAEEESGGAINANALRIAVALGVSIGLALGTFRIVTGTPLPNYILVGYAVVIVQTIWAPKGIVPLAYDSGGVTTSTVTVPLVTALGLGLATSIPGRNALLDGFGLIAFASLFPIIAVLGYAQLGDFRIKRERKKAARKIKDS